MPFSAIAIIGTFQLMDTLSVRHFRKLSNPHPDLGHSTGFCDLNFENKDYVSIGNPEKAQYLRTVSACVHVNLLGFLFLPWPLLHASSWLIAYTLYIQLYYVIIIII